MGVQNTIIAGNFAGVEPDVDNLVGAFLDLGGNLIGVSGLGSGNTGFTNGATETGTLAHPLEPLLGPLQDNGGPLVGANGQRITLQTEAPLPGSPAIGMGILNGAPPTDERGFPSVVDGLINVGAVSQAQPANADNAVDEVFQLLGSGAFRHGHHGDHWASAASEEV